MAESPGANRRDKRRYFKHLPLKLFDNRHEALARDLSMVNVSLGGVCFRSTASLNPNDRVSFDIHVPGHGHVFGDASVRWAQSFSQGVGLVYGMKFEDVNWRCLQRRRDYLDPRPYRPTGLMEF